MNHLSALLLTLELLPVVLDSAAATGDGRIIFMSSQGYNYGIFDPNNLNSEVEYNRLRSYSNTKLYNVSTTVVLSCDSTTPHNFALFCKSNY